MNAPSGALEGAWQRHRRWSIVADRRHAQIDRWRSVNLGLLTAGAVLGAVAAQPSWPRGLTAVAAGVAAFTLAAAGIVQQRYLNATEVAHWTGARAASEGLKAEVFRYLTRVAPYDGEDPDGALGGRVEAIQEKAGKAGARAVDLQQTQADDRELPAVHDLESYVENRAKHQVKWHQDRIRKHERAASRIRAAELAATVAAALLSAVAAALNTKGLSVWIGVATTIGAALAAHLSATQHDRIATSYAATADQLDLLIENLPANPDAATRAQFVTDVESRLAGQNESWLSLFPAK
jgi:hypothetical protein